MNLTKCSNGHFYDTDRFKDCPHCKGEHESFSNIDLSNYVWNSAVMQIPNLMGFVVSFGDLPIVHIEFKRDQQTLTAYNRINGSRDGWMTFPEGFFDHRVVDLTDVQTTSILNFLQTIHFGGWKTEKSILQNYVSGAAGFCIRNSFFCVFNNLATFSCLEPSTKDFYSLVDFLNHFFIE